MIVRMFFSNFSEWVKHNEYTEDSVIPPVSEEESRVGAENVLKALGISDEDVESLTLERYWKWESDYEAVAVCRCEKYPDRESLLKVGTVWKDFSDEILSTSTMQGNEMMDKLEFIQISKQ